MAPRPEEHSLGNGWSITKKNGDQTIPDNNFRGTLELFHALQVLCLCWAQTGTDMMESRKQGVPTGTNVRTCELTEALAYYSFVQDKAMTWPGDQRSCVAWLLVRDKETRARARMLYLDKVPFGEALRLAREVHCTVLWTVGNISPVGAAMPVLRSMAGDGTEQHQDWEDNRRRHDPPAPPPSPRGRRDRESRTPPPSAEPCPDFNTKKGCAKSSHDCPHHMRHACNFPNASGKPCGHWQHNALYCPSNPHKLASNKQKKRDDRAGSRSEKGKAKGKGKW